MSHGTPPRLGVVIPTLDEVRFLPGLLDDLSAVDAPHEVVVADGGSADGTRALARERGTRVVEVPRGRATQLNAGARATDAPWLLFLHADVRLPPRTRDALVARLRSPDPERAAYFSFALAGDAWFWRFIEFGQRLRERMYGLAYGDQGLLVSREAFEAVGGYPDQPLMEDVEILRRLGRRLVLERIEEPLVSSPRRYEREGRWYGWLRNTALISLYLAGISPERLVRWYRPEPRRTLLVFAKAPEPGRVKTRLARTIGEEKAAALYRRVGRQVVDQLRGGPYRTVVCYAPADADDSVRAWLGPHGVVFRPQGPGDLGARMAEAFDDAFDDADRVCIVGTDAPEVDRAVVREAFRALERADLVLGPARDGGYYLMALRRPVPELFRDVPWSTGDVLDATLERARCLGLDVTLLDERSDIDTADDLDPGTLARLRSRRDV